MLTINRNVGVNRGTARIWLEGKNLDAFGFLARTRYTVNFLPNSIKLITCEDGEKAVSGKNVTADYRMPVIDLHNATVSEWLGECKTVTVSFKHGQITIKKLELEAVEPMQPEAKPQPVARAKPQPVMRSKEPPREQLGLF